MPFTCVVLVGLREVEGDPVCRRPALAPVLGVELAEHGEVRVVDGNQLVLGADERDLAAKDVAVILERVVSHLAVKRGK